jgi:hypothetical protein
LIEISLPTSGIFFFFFFFLSYFCCCCCWASRLLHLSGSSSSSSSAYGSPSLTMSRFLMGCIVSASSSQQNGVGTKWEAEEKGAGCIEGGGGYSIRTQANAHTDTQNWAAPRERQREREGERKKCMSKKEKGKRERERGRLSHALTVRNICVHVPVFLSLLPSRASAGYTQL